MLVFLDESYEDDGTGTLRHVWAGFGIAERNYRGLVAALHQSKQKYFIQAAGMSNAEVGAARSTHIVTSQSPELAEVKATKLLTMKSARYHQQYGNAPGILMANALLDAMVSGQVTVFGALSFPDRIADLQDKATLLPIPIVRTLERIELWMAEQHPEEYAIVVPDKVHEGIDHHLSSHMANFLFRSPLGKRMRHIVANPFWVDSKTSAGSQYADLVAHILLNAMRPQGQRKPIDDLWRKICAQEFRSVDFRTRGIRKIKKQQAGA